MAVPTSWESRLTSSAIGVPAGAACIVSTATLSDLASRQRPSNRWRISGVGPVDRAEVEVERRGDQGWVRGGAAGGPPRGCRRPRRACRCWPPSTRASSNLSNSSSAIWRRAVSSVSLAKQSVLQATNTPNPPCPVVAILLRTRRAALRRDLTAACGPAVGQKPRRRRRRAGPRRAGRRTRASRAGPGPADCRTQCEAASLAKSA